MLGSQVPRLPHPTSVWSGSRSGLDTIQEASAYSIRVGPSYWRLTENTPSTSCKAVSKVASCARSESCN